MMAEEQKLKEILYLQFLVKLALMCCNSENGCVYNMTNIWCTRYVSINELCLSVFRHVSACLDYVFASYRIVSLVYKFCYARGLTKNFRLLSLFVAIVCGEIHRLKANKPVGLCSPVLQYLQHCGSLMKMQSVFIYISRCNAQRFEERVKDRLHNGVCRRVQMHTRKLPIDNLKKFVVMVDYCLCNLVVMKVIQIRFGKAQVSVGVQYVCWMQQVGR